MEDRALPSLRRRDLRVAAAAACLLLGALSGRALGSPKAQTPEAVFVRPAEAPIVVRWEARALAPGARFRLFRGALGAQLELVAELAAEDGLRTYRVRDDSAPGLAQVYELRVVDREGREVPLRRISCERYAACSPATPAASGSVSRPLAARLQASPGPPGPALAEVDFSSSALAPTDSRPFDPPVPPPREAPVPLS